MVRSSVKAIVGAIVSGILIMHAPRLAQGAPDDPWFSADKTLHFAATTAISAGGYALSSTLFDAKGDRLMAGGILALGAGAAKELYDLSGRGDASWRDFAWDAAGTAVGLSVAWLIDRLLFGETEPEPEHARALRHGSPAGAFSWQADGRP